MRWAVLALCWRWALYGSSPELMAHVQILPGIRINTPETVPLSKRALMDIRCIKATISNMLSVWGETHSCSRHRPSQADTLSSIYHRRRSRPWAPTCRCCSACSSQICCSLMEESGKQSPVRPGLCRCDVVSSVRSSASFTCAFMTPHNTAALASKVFFGSKRVFMLRIQHDTRVCVSVSVSATIKAAACDYVVKHVYRHTRAHLCQCHTSISVGGGEFPSGENRFLV